MNARSPYPDVEVPEISRPRFVLDRADERGTAVPLMGPADHGSASPLMGPATEGSVTPLMGRAAPATVTPLMGPAAPATVTPLMGNANRGTTAPLMGIRGQARSSPCSEGAYETPTIRPSSVRTRVTVCPHGSVRAGCSSS
jgi:hypothetical protein